MSNTISKTNTSGVLYKSSDNSVHAFTKTFDGIMDFLRDFTTSLNDYVTDATTALKASKSSVATDLIAILEQYSGRTFADLHKLHILHTQSIYFTNTNFDSSTGKIAFEHNQAILDQIESSITSANETAESIIADLHTETALGSCQVNVVNSLRTVIVKNLEEIKRVHLNLNNVVKKR